MSRPPNHNTGPSLSSTSSTRTPLHGDNNTASISIDDGSSSEVEECDVEAALQLYYEAKLHDALANDKKRVAGLWSIRKETERAMTRLDRMQEQCRGVMSTLQRALSEYDETVHTASSSTFSPAATTTDNNRGIQSIPKDESQQQHLDSISC
eukprot:PhM_4_TR2246/c0_g1_i1/m.56